MITGGIKFNGASLREQVYPYYNDMLVGLVNHAFQN